MTHIDTVHIYKNRHLFLGDEHIGKYDQQHNTAYLREEFAACDGRVRKFFAKHRSHPVKVEIGNAASKSLPQIKEFPPEIIAEMLPSLGDLTPQAIRYAQDNWTREEFELRYRNRVPWGKPVGDLPPPEEEPELERPLTHRELEEAANFDDDDEDEAPPVPEVIHDAWPTTDEPAKPKRGRPKKIS